MDYIKSLAVSVSLVAAISVLTSQQASADAELSESSALSELSGLHIESKPQSTSGKILLAQSQSDDAGAEKGGTTPGGASKQSGMSERIRKYMGGDDGPGLPGRPPGEGPGPGPGEVEMGGGRERIRERLQQLSPEKRDQIMQEMKERRMRKRGIDGASGAMDAHFMGGPEGGPDGGPGFGGRPGSGVSEFGFKRKSIRKGPPGDGKGMKGGKFFGRQPLDLTVLNLTAEQKAKIQSLRTVDGQKARQLQSELRQRRSKFKELLFDPAATSDQIIGTHREINKLQSQTQDIMLNDFLGIRKLLTKEQLELLPQVRPDESRRRPSPRLGQKPPPDGERPPISGLRGDFDTSER